MAAQNGAEALTVAHQHAPSIILLDLMMPVLDGYGFRKRQRADDSIANIPVVCISGTHNARAAAEQIGAVACVEKPIRLDDLMEAIRRALHDKRRYYS